MICFTKIIFRNQNCNKTRRGARVLAAIFDRLTNVARQPEHVMDRSSVTTYVFAMSVVVSGDVCETNRWSLVFENDVNGTTLYGRRGDLVAALRAGATLTVYVPGMATSGYVMSSAHVHIEQDLVCAQTKETSRAGWGNFNPNTYWWIFMVCSSGRSHMTRYYVGGHFYSRNTAKYAARWYVKYLQKTQPVLTQDPTGQVVAGSIAALKQAVRDGKAMYALIGNVSQADLLPLTNVAIANGHVAAQSVNRVSLKSCADGLCQFDDNATLQSYVLSTAEGVVVETRRLLDIATIEPQVRRQAAIRWLVDDFWTLALVHDGAGQVVRGSLDCLRDAVRKGHRVRVRLPGLHDNTAEADGVKMKNGVVSAYFVSLVSDVNDVIPNPASDHPTHALWMTVSTSGTVRIRWQKLGSDESGRIMRREFDEVMWFIDTRPWDLVLSVDARGTVIHGRKVALTEAIKGGASVRISSDGGLVSAENMGLNGNDVDTQNNHHISLRTATDNANDFEFQSSPYWYFTIATTTGRRAASRWTYGIHESRGQTVDNVPMDWFVSY